MNSKTINIIIIVLMVFLSIPTTAILASNNALPGDPMYSVKTTLENIASIFTSPSYQAHSELEIQLIQRRIEENQALLLNSGSTKGLALLVAQAEAAKEYILNSNSNQKIKTQAVNRLVKVLQESQQKLEDQKQNIASAPTLNVENPTISQGNSPQENQDFIDPGDIDDKIDDAKDDIDKILGDLAGGPAPEPTPTPEPEPEPTEAPESESEPTEEPESESASASSSASESESESESEENQTQTTSCNQSCNISGFENGQCRPNQACTDGSIHNTSGDQFCPDNKICCCIHY